MQQFCNVSSSSASYGRQFAMDNVPNLVPAPSGGLDHASVQNTSNDLVTNDTPSTFLIPSSHAELNDAYNEFQDGDMVFALNQHGCYFPKYDTDYKSQQKSTVPLVTLTKLNKMLREFAENAMDSGGFENVQWWQNAVLVARWAKPLGVVINKMRVNMGTTVRTSSSPPQYGLNICVSRKANVKHNFMTVKNGGHREWFAQSTMPVAVQYSTEKYYESDNVQKGKGQDIVIVTMMLLDEPPETPDLARHKPLELTNTGARYPGDIEAFKAKPLKAASVLVQIGRVLNSSTNSPTAYMALNSSFNKVLYDSLSPIEIELGCN